MEGIVAITMFSLDHCLSWILNHSIMAIVV